MSTPSTDPPSSAESGPREVGAVPAGDRPVDLTPVHTRDLPATPQRTRTIPATAWVDAPPQLLALGAEFGGPEGPNSASVAGNTATFLRRIGPWLLWRAGPSRGREACYWSARADRLDNAFTFRLFPDGTGDGAGPSGDRHTRFRAWKEDLRDHD